jgi:DNA-binding SARP family transcriptional activator/tetratricopeptide (TPR) repeat protein
MLGAFEVLTDAGPVQLGGSRVRNLLAVLALSPGQAVETGVLIERCWGAEAPADTKGSLHVAVRRLRVALGADTIGTTDYGYYLNLPPAQVDTVTFAGLLTGGADQAAVTAALALWGGEPFGSGFCDWLNRHERPRLIELYLSAIERRAELRVADGHAAESLPELFELTASHPLRESLWVSLLTSLAAAGRPAEAIDVYGVVRARIADELGVEPGVELRTLFERLLAAERPVTAAVVEPHQLPRDVPGFVGRDEVLAGLDAVLADQDPVRAVVLHGEGGVGKTATAVHWGHRVAEQFPDGELFVDLHGYGPGEPMDSATALEILLGGLGQPAPSGLDARAALLRSTLAGRRVLVILDNARTEEQVRPLLPGGGSVVVVTSRSRLRGLSAREGAGSVPVTQLTAAAARRMLRDRLRAEVYDDALLDLLAERCNHLPLALAVAADHVQQRGVGELRAVVQELEELSDRLDLLELGDASSDLRTVVSWSVDALDEPARRLFQLLGLCPSPLFSSGVAAALSGTPVAAARRLLRRLVDVHLVEESAGVFRLHDLLRAYAAELVAEAVPAADRWTAEEHLLDWYAQTAVAARIAGAGDDPRIRPDRLDGVEPLEFADPAAAAEWFASEGRFLAAAVRMAHANGHPRLAAHLAIQLWDDLRSRGAVDEAIDIQRIAIAAAHEAGLPAVELVARNQLAGTLASVRDLTGSEEQLTAAMELSADDLAGELMARLNLAHLKEMQGDYDAAVELNLQTAAICREQGDRSTLAWALNALAVCAARMGDPDGVLAPAAEALAIAEELDDPQQVTVALNALGEAHSLLGDRGAAVSYLERAATTALRSREYVQAIDVLADLGVAHRRAGDLPSARAAWARAENLLQLLAPGTSPAIAERLRKLLADD